MPRLLIILLVGILAMLPPAAGAEDARITRIEPHIQDSQLLLDADIEFTLNDELEEAARKGVPLYFTADLELTRPRWWWFDETLINTSETWRIQFNALTRQWRIGTGDLSLPATSLKEALDLVRHIRDWSVGSLNELSPDVTYEGRLKLRLDTSRLARPFQVDALNSSAWSLTTPWKKFTFSISADTHRH